MYKYIVEWYANNKRELEFRKYQDPYAIWVSEIMAQQTKIDTMIPYFIKWMQEFPTIDDCANAPIERILKIWEGLGYYRRARLLHLGCNYVKEHYNSIFPSDLELIKNIPGIGEYTASAISSIVYNQPNPAIDGNVNRIVARILAIKDEITKSSTKNQIHDVVKSWMLECDSCNYSYFTQGLMEIGALVCTPQNPDCINCPLSKFCLAYKENNQENYPIKPTKKKIPVFDFAVLIIQNNQNILISKDWEDGLMKGLIRLPQITLDELDSYENCEHLGNYNHVFSHKKWNLSVFRVNTSDFNYKKSWFWISFDEIRETALITAHKRILEKYTNIM